jgi:hypothetical protein
MGPSARGDAVAHRSTHRRTHPWPFKVQEPAAITTSEFGVGVPRRQEVEFRDGSRIWLQRVDHQDVPDLYLRDLGAPATGTRVDLRELVPELAKDLPVASTRDVPGLVHYSLRGRFGSVDELLQVAVATRRPE